MRQFMEIVGSQIPMLISFGKTRIYKGSKELNVWYGRYDADKSFTDKIKLIRNNG